MAWVLGDNVNQLVNNDIGNSTGHDSLALADRSFPKFPFENPRNLIAIDKYEWLNSTSDEINPAERSGAGCRARVSARSAVSAECNLNDIEEFSALRKLFPLRQNNWASNHFR